VATAAAVGVAVALAAAAGPVAAHQAEGARGADAAGDRLGDTIERAIREDGPFFTPDEQAVIERACGYPAGSFDGFSVSMSERELRCSNGRRVSSPEVLAVMDSARPRIEARVDRVMNSPGVRRAIDAVSSEATAEALRGIDRAVIARETAAEAAAQARVAVAEVRVASEAAFEEARRAMNDPEVQRGIREARAAAERAMREVGPEVERAMREAEADVERAAQQAERAAEQARARRR
jgi:hypothetical protein